MSGGKNNEKASVSIHLDLSMSFDIWVRFESCSKR
jgi:hypothetical protein